jgi:hypothetical protein
MGWNTEVWPCSSQFLSSPSRGVALGPPFTEIDSLDRFLAFGHRSEVSPARGEMERDIGLCLDPRVKPEDDGVWGATGILLYRFDRTRHEENTLFHSKKVVILGLDPRIQTQASCGHTLRQNAPFPEKKGDELQRFPNKIKPRHVFSSPPIFPLVDSGLSRPRIHLTMRCQARRGRRRDGGLSQT